MLDNKTPKRYSHLLNGTNAKSKQLVSKYLEMQNENRVLLKKMLSIDMKPSNLNPQKITIRQTPSSQSLNRLARLKELIRVNQENRELLKRLQSAHSTYDKTKWDQEHMNNNYLADLIRRNSSRYIKHPYFLNYSPSSNYIGTRSEFFQSVNTGRTFSARPSNRIKVAQSAQGLRSSVKDGGAQTLQPIMEGVALDQIHQQRQGLNSRQQHSRPRFAAPAFG